MKKSALRCIPLLIPALLSAACAQQGEFPSLAPRAVEKLPMDAPERPAPVVAADPALAARIAGLLDAARKGQSQFEASAGSARTAVAAAGSVGSEGWIEAQQALSRLEAARAVAVAALADLDALATARAGVPTNAEDGAALAAALEQASGIATAQQAELARLRAGISDG